MKKISVLFISVLLFLSFTSLSHAYYDYSNGDRTSLIVDEADLLSDAEEELLLEKYEQISYDYACEIALLTVNSTDGKDITAFADDYYDYNGYGYGDNYDGMLLVVDMGNREYAITTYGTAITYFTEYNLSVLEDEFIPYLSDGAYVSAFSAFADKSLSIMASFGSATVYPGDAAAPDDFNYVYNDDEYYYDDDYSEGHTFFSSDVLFASIIMGVIFSLIYTAYHKNQLKTVASKASAQDYVVPGSLQLTHQRDVFMHKNVSRRAKPKNTNSSGRSGSSGSSTHRSSSGRSHGGSRGSF